MKCPYMIERVRLQPNPNYNCSPDEQLIKNTYDACKLMSSPDDDCVGEDKCPIYLAGEKPLREKTLDILSNEVEIMGRDIDKEKEA